MDTKFNSSSIERFLAIGLAMILLSGCSVIQGFTGGSSAPPGAEQTAIAQQVAALAATSAALKPVEPAQPVQPVQLEQPTQTPLPTQTPQPTYTPLPTYTLVPTFTPLPTYTPFPTFTLPASYQQVSSGSPTPNPEQRGCCTLRVRNMFHKTYWIGTKLPYGGNFIKPLWYVEFYPPEPTWMRIWVCRYTSYFYEHRNDYNPGYYNENWNDNLHMNYWNYWRDRGHLYNCFYRDQYVDETLIEISVP